MNHRSTSSQSREFINEVYPASKSREVEEIDFPKDKFDTEGDQRNETPAKRTTKDESVEHPPSFFFSFSFFFLRGSAPSSRSWILKDDTVNKGRLQPEMRFFFLRNNYFVVPTNAGGVSYGANRTDTGASR